MGPLTFKVLGAIERLLFLQQKGIADKWKAAHGLAMASEKKSDNSAREVCDLRIWPWNTLIVSEVGRVILTLSSLADTRDLGCNVCRPFVRAHEVRCTIRARFARD